MKKIKIEKSENGVFAIYVTTSEDFDGVSPLSGNDIKIGIINETFVVQVLNETHSATPENLSLFNNGTEVTFSGLINYLEQLKNLGFTGNFNTPQAGGSQSSFNKILSYDGNDITVPTGFTGTIFNLSNNLYLEYTVTGTDLTITSGAEISDNLLLTSN